MEATAYIKNVAISPKKIRFILAEVKRMPPVQALHHLRYTNKASAKYLYKAIQSAITNAKNTLNTGEDLLQFKVLTVEEGRKLKRYRAGGRGMAKPYAHKYSHIKVVVMARNATAHATAKPAQSGAAKKQEPEVKTEESKKGQSRPRIAVPRETRRTGARNVAKQRTVTRQKKG